MEGLIIITGASSGIGEATATLFMEKGHSLLLLARRLERLEKFKRKNVLLRKVDVTDLKAFREAVGEAEQELGPTSALVNNAGIVHVGLMAEQDPQEWKQMFEVNVMGVLHGMHLVLPGMVKRKKGTIVNISSVAGRKVLPHFTAYCGTKFAVHALTEGVRQEVAKDNVRVINISPGVVDTEIFDHATSEKAREENQNLREQVGGSLTPHDIAEAIYFAYTQKDSTCIREMIVAPTVQEH